MTIKTDPPYKKGDIIEVQFETMALGGACKGTPVGKHPGFMSVFASSAAPGDVARVRVDSVVKRYINAEIEEIITPSPQRATPQCPIFNECGGCDWQHLSYEAQLAQSDDIAAYSIKRLGNIDSFEHILEPTHGAPSPYGYRVRGDMAARASGGEVELGFRRKNSRRIIETTSCPIMKPALSAALPAVKEALVIAGLIEGEDYRIRVVLDEIQGLVAAIPVPMTRFQSGPIEGWIIDTRDNKAKPVQKFGDFTTSVSGLDLSHHPSAFTQVNPEVNRILADYVAASLKPSERDVVLELYAGIGNFTIPISSRVKRMIAVESFSPARENIRSNARKHRRENIEHVSDSALHACGNIVHAKRPIDKILTDPPRKGMGHNVCVSISKIAPRRIVYLSCDIDSLRDDIKILHKGGFILRALTPFDMFPQSWHKEYLAVLDLCK